MPALNRAGWALLLWSAFCFLLFARLPYGDAENPWGAALLLYVIPLLWLIGVVAILGIRQLERQRGLDRWGWTLVTWMGLCVSLWLFMSPFIAGVVWLIGAAALVLLRGSLRSRGRWD